MLENRLFIDKVSSREKIYEQSKKKWIIDFQDTLTDWDVLYERIRQEMDVCDYDKEFGKSIHTLSDILGEEELFKKIEKKGIEGIVIILDYSKSLSRITSQWDKEQIYYDLILRCLLEWYRDLRIMYQDLKLCIDQIIVEVYFLVDDILLKQKNVSFQNQFVIATMSDVELLKKSNTRFDLKYDENKNKEEFFCQYGREFVSEQILENFRSEIEKVAKLSEELSELELFIYNFDKLIDSEKLWIYLVEDILMKKFLEGKEAKVYAIFADTIW